jgi:hypothetical protein
LSRDQQIVAPDGLTPLFETGSEHTDISDALRNAGRVGPNHLGDDVGIEQVAHQSSTGRGVESWISGKSSVIGRRQNVEQGLRRDGFHDEFFALFAYHSILAG